MKPIAIKNTAALFLTLLLCTGPARAEDECPLPLDALKPVIQANAPGYRVTLDKDARSITEETTLADGMKITYTAGGCAHYAYSFHFENIPGGTAAMPDDPFGLPQSLLSKVPLRDPAEFQILHNTLRDKDATGYAAFDENNRTEWGCGDAFCSLILNGSEDVTIGYDFAI